MRVLMTGAGGLVGAALRPALEVRGDTVVALRRATAGRGGGPTWDPAGGELDPAVLADIDAIIHLAGEPIANGRWTARKKASILRSRVDGTALLARCIAKADRSPPVLLSASAAGYYGDRGDELLTETAGSGSGFLADVCRKWEAATEPASAAGVRVVHLRFGVVLSPGGGALARMLPPFRLGLGGPMGSGRQYLSWIALSDLVQAVLHLLHRDAVSGPVNMVAPDPVRNATFARALGRALHRPASFRVPATVARLLVGELADEALLASQRAVPGVLDHHGFDWQLGGIDAALDNMLT